jgi:hypothetical protein
MNNEGRIFLLSRPYDVGVNIGASQVANAHKVQCEHPKEKTLNIRPPFAFPTKSLDNPFPLCYNTLCKIM